MRALYLVGVFYFGLCLYSVLADVLKPVLEPVNMFVETKKSGNWYESIKPYCNSVEIAVRIKNSPPPSNREGQAYAAGCYALAGEIDEARRIIDKLSLNDRTYASGIVFGIAHPIADAGDDLSAGPIMRLVVDYDPSNAQALYHAGMSEYALKQFDLSKTHLERFVELYTADDGWRRNSLDVLQKMKQQPLDE